VVGEPLKVTIDEEDEEPAMLPDREFFYQIEHQLQGKWTRRGEMKVHLQSGEYGVKLSDAASFSPTDLSNELQKMAQKNAFYKLRLVTSDNSFALHCSIPAQFVTDTEDRHDMFEIVLSPSGTPVGFNYRVRETLGLKLFDHTAGHISEPHYAIEPHVTPRKLEEDKQKQEQAQGGSFLTRYWWVILIGVLLVAAGGGGQDDKPAAGGGGGGGA